MMLGRVFKFAFLILLVGCGKGYYDTGESINLENLPLVYNVPSDKYERYKKSFDFVEESYKSKSGKDLVKFVPKDENPKFSEMTDAFSLQEQGNGNWVLFKEESDEFTDIDWDTIGVYYGYVPSGYGNIFLNIDGHASSSNRIKKVLLHEVGHAVGFDHTENLDYSTMNYNFNLFLPTLSRYDKKRLHDKYPFEVRTTAIKDLELMGARKEEEQIDILKESIENQFGLSESRSLKIAKSYHSFKRLGNKRSIEKKDWDILTRKLFGFDYQTGKKALERHIQGDSSSLENLKNKAAELNETSPQHIQEILGEYFF